MKKTTLRVQRVFSEDFRKETVKRIESGHLSVTQASRDLNVSPTSIYNWLNKYSRNLKSGARLVMEKDSVDKTIAELRSKIQALEAALGRKSMEVDLYKTIVELASKDYETDLKKNFGSEASPTSKEKE
jgi:transposase-like protein